MIDPQMKRSQKSEFRSQNTPCLKSGVSSKEYFFSPPQLKLGALDYDSSTSRTEFNSEFWLLTPKFFFGNTFQQSMVQ
jgi:hypothetical protein